jgi:hypothetical protein
VVGQHRGDHLELTVRNVLENGYQGWGGRSTVGTGRRALRVDDSKHRGVRPADGMVVCTSRPPVGRDVFGRGLFVNKKNLLTKRPSREDWKKIWHLPPVQRAGGIRPHVSRLLIGREVPIFANFSNGHPFFEFNFYFNPFLKKILDIR